MNPHAESEVVIDVPSCIPAEKAVMAEAFDIEDTPLLSPGALRAKARSIKREHGKMPDGN